MDEIYYFAYGSNLDKSQMEKRIGKWLASERAHAEGYKLVFNVWAGKNWGGWAANIKETIMSSDNVCGVAYSITDKQLKILTGYEGTEPTSISVRLEGDPEPKSVRTYIWLTKEPSHEPPETYKNAIIRGLKEHGYAQDVIERIQNEFRPS